MSSEFNRELEFSTPSSPLELTYHYAFEVMDRDDDHSFIERVVKALYVEASVFGFLGKEYSVTAKNGLFLVMDSHDEENVRGFIPEGQNTFQGRFAKHNHRIFFHAFDADGRTVDDAEVAVIDGLGLYFEDVHLVTGDDAEDIEEYELENTLAYFAPIKDIGSFVMRSHET